MRRDFTEHRERQRGEPDELRDRFKELEELLPRLDELQRYSRVIEQETSSGRQPAIVIVDTPVLLSHLYPTYPLPTPRHGLTFWTDHAVQLGTLSWFFEKSGFPLLLLPTHFAEIRKRFTQGVSTAKEEDARKASDSEIRAMIESVRDRLDGARSWLSKAREKKFQALPEVTRQMRYIVAEVNNLLISLGEAHPAILERRRAADRFWSLTERDRIMGLPRLMRKLQITERIAVSEGLKSDAMRLLIADKPYKTDQNDADAEAFALFLGIRNMFEAKRSVFVVTSLELFRKLAREFDQEKRFPFSAEDAVWDMGYFAVLLATLGGDGTQIQPDARDEYAAAIRRWNSLHESLTEVAGKIRTFIDSADGGMEERLRAASAHVDTAKETIADVGRLFNEMRAQCSIAGMSHAIHNGSLELEQAIDDAPDLLGNTRKPLQELRATLDALRTAVLTPGNLDAKLAELNSAVGELNGVVNRIISEFEVQIDATTDHIEQVDAAISGAVSESAELLYEVLREGVLGRVRKQVWEGARVRLEMEQEQHGTLSPADARLGSIVLDLAGWPIWIGGTSGQALVDLSDSIGRRLSEVPHRANPTLEATRMFASAQHAYMQGDYRTAHERFAKSGKWRWTPLGALRHGQALYHMAQSQNGRSLLEDALARVNGALDTDEVKNDPVWYAVLKNSEIYYRCHLDTPKSDSLQRWIKTLERCHTDISEAEGDESGSAYDRAALLDTIGYCWLLLARIESTSEAVREAYLSARRRFLDAYSLDSSNQGIAVHLAQVMSEMVGKGIML